MHICFRQCHKAKGRRLHEWLVYEWFVHELLCNRIAYKEHSMNNRSPFTVASFTIEKQVELDTRQAQFALSGMERPSHNGITILVDTQHFGQTADSVALCCHGLKRPFACPFEHGVRWMTGRQWPWRTPGILAACTGHGWPGSPI